MTRCNRPGCPGTLDEAGYCRVCLERPVEGAQPQIPGVAGAGAAPAGPTPAGEAAPVSRRASGDPWWGLDLVTLPEIPAVEPAQSLRPEPSVSVSERICGACGTAIGRSHDGQVALVTGSCHQCGKPYSFVPKLQRGTMVADRYRVSGCIGYGGLGWVFLAEDTHLKDQPVVLKGLIDAGNPRAADTAERELRFLTEVDHPNIVRVRDFAAHTAGSANPDDYIVMEYIPGHSVDRLALLDSGLTMENAVAYCLHLLAAVEHLHSKNWLHCDIKPHNVMLAGTGVKLIDLGAGCQVDARGHTWGTKGYRAPEVTRTGRPSVRSDLFSIGRTLKHMLHWTGEYPEPDAPDDTGRAGDSPGPSLGAATQSLDNFIARATAQDPADRFRTAAEMAGQLSGVLREIVARRAGQPQPAPPLLFGAESQCLDTELGGVPPLRRWTSEDAFRAAANGSGRPLPDSLPAAREAAVLLPVPRPDPADPAAALLATLGGADADFPGEQLAIPEQGSAEANLFRCRTRLAAGDPDGARKHLVRAADIAGHGEWRIRWHSALIKLADGGPADALGDFDAVYRALPGEIVPKLALGLCQEYQGEPRAAQRLYLTAWQADRSYVSTAFGLARTRIRLGDRAGAVTAADEVPDSSRHASAARVAAVRLLTGQAGASAWPTEAELTDAAERLERPPLADGDLGDERRCRLRALLLEARLHQATLAARTPSRAGAGKARADIDGARAALEECYRTLAKYATSQSQHTILIDLANQVRARTLD